MGNYIKKIMQIRFDRYQDTETRLEAFALKGMFLSTCGPIMWTFKKGEPRRLNYAIAYFPEGSIYAPDISANQQAYLDLAYAAGWKLVTHYNQMHIFCNEAEHPVPFETDEKEKLDNIKACMRKSFVPSMIVMILTFMLNFVIQIQSFWRNPIDCLSNNSQLLSIFMILIVLVYEVYALLNYFIWCKRSERQIAGGGGCISNTSLGYKLIDMIFISFIFGCLAYFLCNLFFEVSLLGLLLCILQIPVLFLIFTASIKHMKKIKVSALVNKIISITVLALANFAYLALLLLLIIKFDFSAVVGSDYRTVTWPVTPSINQDYRLYKDFIPLTCEDLYGEINYDYYSYEKEVASTFFLTKTSYRQSSLPAKDAPPEIEYEILESPYRFVNQLAKEQLLTVPQWRESMSFHEIDSEIFGTADAYQEYYGADATGRYILFFEDKIVTLGMDDAATEAQIAVIRENLLYTD